MLRHGDSAGGGRHASELSLDRQYLLGNVDEVVYDFLDDLRVRSRQRPNELRPLSAQSYTTAKTPLARRLTSLMVSCDVVIVIPSVSYSARLPKYAWRSVCQSVRRWGRAVPAR